jgi:RNA polymerase sigma-70 factor (ECF subfamily)
MDLDTYRQLRAQALRLTCRVEEAEDLVQDTLLAALQAHRADLPWLTGVLRHQAAMAARTAIRRRQRETRLTIDEATPADEPAPTSRAWLATLPPSARRVAVLALHGLSADEIRWILRIEPTAFRQRLTRIRKALGELPPELRAQSLALAYVRDPVRSVELQFGLVRRALKAAMEAGEGLGTHDPDGHLLVIVAGAHTTASRGNL